ncbi:MAG: LacI family transcriptional regulator [Planctomycetes bacterium]|nr:LacI family transcriptional regulator [Planctomycetota bacterium]
MTSIKDVAKLAGVSVMTASRVMNNSDSVSPEAKTRVLDAAKTLDYRPNLTARSLRMKRSHLFGLLLPDIENPVFASLAKHVEEAADKLGYSVILANTWEDPKREAKHFELMLSRRMDGIIISPVSTGNDRLIRLSSAPVVLLDRSYNHVSPPPAVTMDNVECGRIAARHFMELGHRHFACIPGPLHIDVFAERLEGFRDELARNGNQLEAVVNSGDIGKIDFGARSMEQVLRMCRSTPLALFAANDLVALGAMQAAARLGFSVPDDISIIGVDDIPAGVLTNPTLTTVRQPVAAIADAGVDLLVKMLGDKDFQPENVILSPELIVRESTGKFR